MNNLVVITVLIALSLAIGFMSRRIERSRRKKRLSGRECLSDLEIVVRFYDPSMGTKTNFLAAWHLAAKLLEVEPGLLRADDTAETLNGKPTWVGSFENAMDDLEFEINVHLRRKSLQSPDVVTTVGEAVRELAS